MNDPVSMTILSIGDFLLGWLMWLPRDVPLFVLAVLTAVILVVVRRWATNQDQLRRAKADRRTLKRLRRDAKAKADRAAMASLKALQARIGMMRLKAEVKPLLWAIVPIALLATWCYERLPYLPPKPGSTFTIELLHPVSAHGDLAHVVLPSFLEPVDRLLQPILAEDLPSQRYGIATWQLTRQLSPAPHDGPSIIQCVSPMGRFDHPFEPSPTRLPLIARNHDDAGTIITRLVLEERRLLGVVPGIPALALPAWLVGYLIIVIAFIPVIRRVFRLQ